MAPLLPKLRGHFAEFLNNASSAGLRILSSSTCVGLRYGWQIHNSGFSRQCFRMLPYFMFGPRHAPGSACFYSCPLMRLYGSFHSPLILPPCVPAVLVSVSTGISACRPSATASALALGPDFPRADQLYSGNLGYSAWEIPTPISLLIPAFSLHDTPRLLAGTASPRHQCSSTSHLSMVPQLRWCVSAPEIFGAGPLDQ